MCCDWDKVDLAEVRLALRKTANEVPAARNADVLLCSMTLWICAEWRSAAATVPVPVPVLALSLTL